MNKKAERIKKGLSSKFPDWTRDFREFIEWQHHGLYGPDFNETGLWDSIEYLYTTLMESMIHMNNIRDQWEGPEYFPLAVKAGLQVYYRSGKLECPFFFGTDEIGFFMSADLLYAEHIRKMDDNFWFYIAELTRFGELDLWEHRGWPESRVKKEPWFHRKTKSHIFQLIRSAVVLEKEDGHPGDLGMLIVRWNYNIGWEDLLDKGSAAFYNLYRINEALRKKHR